jgi:uncharacterized protein involved in exopolysaccharide biosynthesis
MGAQTRTGGVSDWQDDDTLDLRDIVATLWAKRLWIIASVVVFTALFVTAAYVIKPVYRSTTVLVSTSSERSNLSGAVGSALGNMSGLASLAGINLGTGNEGTQEAIAVLRSRDFTQRFIADLKLMPKLWPEGWDAAGKWQGDPAEQPTLAKANKYFDARIRKIIEDKKTGLVTLHIDWRDPKESADWANELVRRLNEEMRRRAILNSEASVKYLEKELESTSTVGTREAINRLMETQIRQRMLANVTQEFAFRVVDPALPADRDDPLRPQKILLFAAGPALGFVFGCVLVLALDWFGRRRRSQG